MTYLVVDLETNVSERYGRKGNFLYADIVAIGIKERDKNPIASLDVRNTLGWRLASTPGITTLIGHNFKFDLLHLWNCEFLQMWFKQPNSKIWCTALAEYILSGQQHKYPALRDIAVNKYGCPEREKYMEKYWDKGYDTCQIPREVVLEDVKNDVLDTEIIALAQVKKAKDKGMLSLIKASMDALLATTEMEYNGMYVDQHTLSKNRDMLTKEMRGIEDVLQDVVKNYWVR